jgi:hypothetical protein
VAERVSGAAKQPPQGSMHQSDRCLVNVRSSALRKTRAERRWPLTHHI